MKKFIFNLLIILIFISGCQTIKKKSDEVAEKENERYGQFVGKQVVDLKMELGAPTEDFINEIGNETGKNEVIFKASTNPNQKLGPLNKIASGGELSRFLLAVKVVLSNEDNPKTLVFDEVDSGIGGKTASAVGLRLKILGKLRLKS